MLISLGCLIIAIVGSKRMFNLQTGKFSSEPGSKNTKPNPAVTNSRTSFEETLQAIRKNRTRNEPAPINDDPNKGFTTYEETIRNNLRHKIKREHWKEHGLE